MAPTSTTTENLTRAGLNLIQQALSIYDSDLRCVRVNRPFREMFGLPDALCRPGANFEATIRYLAECGDYGEIDNIDEFVAIRIKQAREFEPHYLERTRANGQTIAIEGNPLPGGGWIAVYTDITAIKDQEKLLRARSAELSDQVLDHAENLSKTNRELAATNAALEEAKHQLTEMEARARLTTEMMPAHIAHIDQDGFYTYSNRRLSTILSSSPPNILGMHISDALGAQIFAKLKPRLTAAFNGQANVSELTDDESGRRIRVALNPDKNGVYILSMDVTEEAQARAALAHTHKRELAAQLTSGMAHDFANLLTIILGMQSRLSRLVDTDEARELITATLSAARRGGTLLNRIADLSAPREIRLTAVRFCDIMQNLQTLANPTLPDGVTLACDCSGISRPVMLDAGALRDTLLNLILNAKDAIGDAAGQITITARPLRDTWIEITVADTGPGFSNTALAHALDPFFSTKGGEGSGLGLSMVYDHIKLAGGHIRLINTPTGATVSLRLPLRSAPAETAPRMILLVEDSDDIRTNVREMLTDMGHRVIEAASAEEGTVLAMLEGVDFILSDISLVGETTGIEMLDNLEQSGLGAATCLMTSRAPNDPLRIDGASRYRLLPKPFTAAELAAFIASDPAP
jgi:signal transduction histidine kinase